MRTNKLPIGWVCSDCGLAANYLTCWKKYGGPPTKIAFDVSTFHLDTCDFCNQKRQVTEARDFFHPDFELLRKVVNEIRKDPTKK